jgi:hypothetical protein
MNTKTPTQFSKYGNLLKSFLHTQFGARVGFYLNIRGFNRVGVVHTSALTGKQTFKGFSYNARVNKGADLSASLLSGTSFNSITSPLPPKYVALSTAVLTPAAGDTTLASETAVSGLARALGTQGTYTTPVVLDGAASYTVTKTFTNTTAGVVTINSAGLFDAASTGNLFAEANLSVAAAMQVNDTLAITWTINL